MRRSHRRTTILASIAIACAAARVAVAAPSAERLIHNAKSYEEKLLGDTSRLKMRHNLEKLIVLWSEARKEAKGKLEKEAAEGEARAWKLLAHWSGRPEDRQRAASAEKAPKKETPKRAWLTKLRLDDGVVVLHTDSEVTTRREVIPAHGKNGTRVLFDLSPAVAASDAIKTINVDSHGVRRARVGQFDEDTARVVIDLDDGGDVEAIVLAQKDGRLAIALGKPTELAFETEKHEAEKHEAEKHEAEKHEAETPAATGDVLAQIVEEMRKTTEELEARKTSNRERAPDPEPEPEPIANAETAQRAEPIEQPREPQPQLEPEAPLADVKLKASTRDAVRPRDTSILQIQRVVIDAGHGGKDHGAIGKGGVREKDVNLAIALELGKEIERRLGLKVVYTRKTDEFLSLRRRTQIANKSNGDIFISIHSNAHKKRSIAGIETYYLNTTSDRYSERLALRENAESGHDEESFGEEEPGVGMAETEDSNLPGGAIGRDLRLILADLAMRSATSESRRLAGYVQSTLVGTLKRSYDDVTDLGVKHALFYVLLGPRMPSVLIETGFVTNPTEGARLNDPKYRRDVAAAIAKGLGRFIEERNQLARRVDRKDDETLASVRR